MNDHDCPDSFRELLARIAAAQQRARTVKTVRDRKEQLREASRQERRDRDRPAAHTIMKWAATVADSGVLDQLDEPGLLLHRQDIGAGYRTLRLRRDGSLSSGHYHYAGGGLIDLRSVDELLLRVDGGVIEELAEQVESQTIWQKLETLNGQEGPAPLKRIRTRHRQLGPSCNLDDAGDPIPPRWITTYETETDEAGFWEEIGEEEAQQLLDDGLAVQRGGKIQA